MLRPLAQRINRTPLQALDEVVLYRFECVCRTSDEAQIRALLLQNIGRTPLVLYALHSEDEDMVRKSSMNRNTCPELDTVFRVRIGFSSIVRLSCCDPNCLLFSATSLVPREPNRYAEYPSLCRQCQRAGFGFGLLHGDERWYLLCVVHVYCFH